MQCELLLWGMGEQTIKWISELKPRFLQSQYSNLNSRCYCEVLWNTFQPYRLLALCDLGLVDLSSQSFSFLIFKMKIWIGAGISQDYTLLLIRKPVSSDFIFCTEEGKGVWAGWDWATGWESGLLLPLPCLPQPLIRQLPYLQIRYLHSKKEKDGRG